MPDKNYNVDDILREVRRKQADPPVQKSRPAPAREDWSDQDEDVVEYQPRRTRARREAPAPPPEERRPRRAAREDWPPEEEEEYEPPRRTQARREVPVPPPEERRPRRAAREDWPPEEDEEYEPPRRTQARREAPAPPPEERRPRRAPREDWPPEEDEEYEPPRRTRAKREKPRTYDFGPMEEIGEVRGLTDRQEEPEEPREYFPPVQLDLSQEPAPTPTLDELWQAAERTPAETSRPAGGKPGASRALWEEDEPPRRGRKEAASGRPREAAPSRPLWEEEESPAPRRQTKREAPSAAPGRPLWEEDEAALPRGQERQGREAAHPLWEDDVQPSRQPPRRSPAGEDPASRFEEQIMKTTARAAREEEPPAPAPRRRSAVLGFGEGEGEEPQPPRNPIAFGAEEGGEPPRSRKNQEPEEDRPRRTARERDGEEGRPRRGRETEEDARASRARVLAQLQGMKTGLVIRLVVNLLCAAGVIYLMLAPGHSLPIPEYFQEDPGRYLWLGVGLVAFSALVAGNTIGGGMISLFCLRPNNDSYSAIGVFACLVQGAYMAMRPEMLESYSANLYLPMAALLLLFNTVGKLILRGRIAASYRLIGKEGAKHTAAVIEDALLADKLGKDVIDDEPEIAYFTRASGISAFMDQAFSESKAEDVSKIIAPMTAAAAFVMALISYPFHKDVFTSACVFTAALCITAPIAGVIAANLPITLTNRRLVRWGATLCGYSAVNQLAGVNGVLLRGYDLFPPESVTLHSIKPFNRTPMDEVILEIASVLSQCGSTLTQIFLEMVPDQKLLRETESFTCEDKKGISAWVNGRRVLIGNRELMKAYGVSIPPMEYEDQQGQGKQLLYISNSGQAAAMCVLSYKGDKQMRRALELLADRDIAVCVYTTDPNVTEARISQTYSFPKELVKVMPAALHREMDRYLDPKAKARAGMIHDGSPSSYVRGVAAARSCDAVLTIETALILLSVVVGFALVTFFAFTGGMPALTWLTLAVYQLFWAAVQILVALIKG